MDKIVDYLKRKYAPGSILIYGSFANGTNDVSSDFDCMVIVKEKDISHDDSIVDGVQLDCFIFTEDEVRTGAPEDFITAYFANIVLDNGIGTQLKERVYAYVEEHSVIDEEEKDFIRSWVRKTMKRVHKNDDEGNYRAIAFLWESLEDYFRLRDSYYFGSKKSIRILRKKDPDGYELFHRAITERSNRAIEEWAEYVIGV